MKAVDYDDVAPSYDRRYESNRYDGVHACLSRFLGPEDVNVVVEVGCGTGHWLAQSMHGNLDALIGLDLSAAMLEQASVAAPAAMLVRGTADQLPFANASVDRIFCINAFHHVQRKIEFVSECRRVLRPGGGVLTIGLDPHTGRDKWWIYDFFPAALRADRQRYPAASTIRDWLRAGGFDECVTERAQHIPASMPFEVALERGFVDRRATSQLMVIGDEEFDTGMRRLLSERPVLSADLTLFATTGWASTCTDDLRA